MSKLTTIKPEFVDTIPAQLEEGVLYISKMYGTAVHFCACGCRSKIITPIRPDKWKLIENGDRVSLKPSIGNWSYPCNSHYWITRNQIDWSFKFSEAQIAAVRERDKALSNQYYRQQAGKPASALNEPASLLGKLKGLLFKIYRLNR